MKLRLRGDFILNPTDPLNQTIKDFLVANQSHFLKIDDMNTSSIIVEKCYHDEIPIKPCEKIFEWKQT